MLLNVHLFIVTLLALVALHALADFALQGDYMAKAKDPAFQPENSNWRWVLGQHCVIHAFAVYLVTHSLLMALGEFAIHCYTDLSKCRGYITFGQDQAIHIGCKVVYAALVVLAVFART